MPKDTITELRTQRDRYREECSSQVQERNQLVQEVAQLRAKRNALITTNVTDTQCRSKYQKELLGLQQHVDTVRASLAC